METQVIETVHAYGGFWGSAGHCGLQIFPGSDGILVVILTELPSNDSTSVTNLIESLAAEVLEKYLSPRWTHASLSLHRALPQDLGSSRDV
jgi:hypothetical protein